VAFQWKEGGESGASFVNQGVSPKSIELKKATTGVDIRDIWHSNEGQRSRECEKIKTRMGGEKVTPNNRFGKGRGGREVREEGKSWS